MEGSAVAVTTDTVRPGTTRPQDSCNGDPTTISIMIGVTTTILIFTWVAADTLCVGP